VNGKRERERERNCAINENCRAKRPPPKKKTARSRLLLIFASSGELSGERKRLSRALAALIFFSPRDRAFFLFFPIGNSRNSLPSRSRAAAAAAAALPREREREKRTPPPDRTRERREKKLNERTNKRTRVLLDFGFHPSFQSVVEGFQKRRAVHLCRGGGGRRRG